MLYRIAKRCLESVNDLYLYEFLEMWLLEEILFRHGRTNISHRDFLFLETLLQTFDQISSTS